MLKSLIVILPMLLGAMLARVAHAETAIIDHGIVSMATGGSQISTATTGIAVSVPVPIAQTADRHTVTFAAAEIVESASHLPEPAVWAMLLVGFGATGGLMRRRRAAMIAA